MPDYDNDVENDMELNESILPDVSLDFRKQLMKTKRKLYNSTVFESEGDKSELQDTMILKKYLRLLSILHKILDIQFMQNLQKIQWSSQPWKEFPQQTNEDIANLLYMYSEFLRNNQSQSSRIPYEDYIHNSLHVYPYHQIDSYNENEVNEENFNLDDEDDDDEDNTENMNTSN